MKIAVAYESGQVFQHFGHTEFFMIYNTGDNKIISSELISAMGSGHGALASLLKSNDVDTLICGGIGGGARSALDDAGITVFGGVTGSADDAVNAFLNGNLDYNPDVRCSHHKHEHSCGSQSCGEGNHGCSGDKCNG